MINSVIEEALLIINHFILQIP